jgi:hypothetical protein
VNFIERGTARLWNCAKQCGCPLLLCTPTCSQPPTRTQGSVAGWYRNTTLPAGHSAWFMHAMQVEASMRIQMSDVLAVLQTKSDDSEMKVDTRMDRDHHPACPCYTCPYNRQNTDALTCHQVQPGAASRVVTGDVVSHCARRHGMLLEAAPGMNLIVCSHARGHYLTGSMLRLLTSHAGHRPGGSLVTASWLPCTRMSPALGQQ